MQGPARAGACGKCNWARRRRFGVAPPPAPDSRPPNSHRAQRPRLAKLVGDVLEGRPLLGVPVLVHLLQGSKLMLSARGFPRGPRTCPPRSAISLGCPEEGMPAPRAACQKKRGKAAPRSPRLPAAPACLLQRRAPPQERHRPPSWAPPPLAPTTSRLQLLCGGCAAAGGCQVKRIVQRCQVKWGLGAGRPKLG